MATISEQYLGDLVADAAYVDFDSADLPGTKSALAAALVASTRFTEAAAAAFAEKFEVVAFYSEPSDTGFQGVVFRDSFQRGGDADRPLAVDLVAVVVRVVHPHDPAHHALTG